MNVDEITPVVNPILLAIVGFVGAAMVKQLMRIAKSVQEIQISIAVQASDHKNLKEDHKELKERVLKLETKPA